MKKLLITLILLTSFQANAQFDLNDAPVEPIKKEEPKKTKPKASATSKEDDPFSFMNISFSKKDEAKKVETTTPKKELTYLETLIQDANKGDINALNTLGYMYMYGDLDNKVEIDYKKSFNYYQQAANKNDPTALNNLANIFYLGLGTEENKEVAAQLFEKSAEIGDDSAAVNAAFMYLEGTGVAQDKEKAMSLFQIAADKQNAIANYMLGLANYYAVGVPQDYYKAFDYMSASSKKGLDLAQVFLARLYMNGIGTPQNYGNAITLLTRATKQENVEAMNELAHVYATGSKYPKNIYLAHVLYNLASVKGVANAAQNRANVEKGLKIEDILKAQSEANSYKFAPTEVTTYVRNNYGNKLEKMMMPRTN